MKRNLVYILLAFLFFIAFTIPNLFQPGQSLIFIVEEFIAFILLILGFFAFRKWIIKIVLKLNQKNPWSKNILRRILIDIGIALSLSILLTSFLLNIGSIFVNIYGEPSYYQEIELAVKKQHELRGEHFRIKEFSIFFYAPFLLTTAVFLFSALFFVEESHEYNLLKQKEALAKEQAQKEQALTKVSALQKQLNPHFMFNTLNVLAGLIHEDLDKADKFIKKLSEIYRYVAIQSKEILTPITKELDFVEAYIYLLKIRFENQLEISTFVDESKLDWFIPSLTLELLIENAIKHNSLSSNKPLQIEIIMENERLIVKNNYRPRMNKVKSSKIGIKNLQERLLLLGLESGSFKIEHGFYIASIPLINPNL